MKTLVTGGCGFIGSHIAEALVEQGAEVVVFDNLSSGYERNIASFRRHVQFIRGDIRDGAALTEAMRGVGRVFHEAALVSVFDSVERPLDNHEINVTGTLNVLMAARQCGVERLVMAASAAAYGNNPQLPKTESMRPEPESPYGLAKVTGEYYLRVFARLYGLSTVALRYFNVYGPRQDPSSMYSGVISKFVDTVAQGQNPCVFGDGGQTRDFVFVRDVVRANLLAMEAPALGDGEVVNIGTARAVSLLDLLEVLRDLTGRSFETVFKPERPGDIRHSLADLTLARTRMGYEPVTDIRAGLAELLPSRNP
jgi:UDP-glucose 4-epimerase